MSQLGPRLLSWLALLICCGGMDGLGCEMRLLLRMCLLLVKSRMSCQGGLCKRLSILGEFGAMEIGPVG
jgi:hypothetical protein